MTPTLEKTQITLGYVPLTDCAPLVVALERGLFGKHGLDVTLSREPSWANIRDKVTAGALDGAHMLAGMPLAATLGVGALTRPMVTGMVLHANGNCITVSNDLHDRMHAADAGALASPAAAARALKAVIDADRAAARPPLTFAMTFPVATHNYELRVWLASGGIDPDVDLRIVVVPPPQMVDQLSAGNVQGYCVGEPWNSLAVERGIGRVVVAKSELMPQAPEKVLGVTRDWADRHPQTHLAMIQALLEACVWLDDPGHRMQAAELLRRGGHVAAPLGVIARSLTGWLKRSPHEAPVAVPDFHVFHHDMTNFPWRSYADWTVLQMLRWGQIAAPLDIRAVSDAVYRPALYRSAASALGLPCPLHDRTVHAGTDFDPARPMDYLAAQTIGRLQADPTALAALNPQEAA